MEEIIDESAGELYPIAPAARYTPTTYTPFQGIDSADGVYSNIPRTPSMMPMLVNASQVSDKRAKQVIGRVLDVKYFFAHQLIREDKAKGGSFIGWRCVLITKEAEMISCSGPAIIRAVDMLTRIYGLKPWEPAVPCEIVSNLGRDQHEYHTLKIHDPMIPTAKAVPPKR